MGLSPKACPNLEINQIPTTGGERKLQGNNTTRLNTASLATLEREEHGFPRVEVKAPSPHEVSF